MAAKLLGAITISYYPDDMQVNTGESLHDTGEVLAGYLDMLVVRSAEDWKDMRSLSANSKLSVINAMSSQEHPTQALSDIFTLHEQFGRLDHINFLYVGEGNNTATALSVCLSRLKNSRVTFLTPPGYEMPEEFVVLAKERAKANRTVIEVLTDPIEVRSKYDAVYTARWQTTGTFKPDPLWLETFRPFTVSEQLFDQVKRSEKSVFMHDLPAVRGVLITTILKGNSMSVKLK